MDASTRTYFYLAPSSVRKCLHTTPLIPTKNIFFAPTGMGCSTALHKLRGFHRVTRWVRAPLAYHVCVYQTSSGAALQCCRVLSLLLHCLRPRDRHAPRRSRRTRPRATSAPGTATAPPPERHCSRWGWCPPPAGPAPQLQLCNQVNNFHDLLKQVTPCRRYFRCSALEVQMCILHFQQQHFSALSIRLSHRNTCRTYPQTAW